MPKKGKQKKRSKSSPRLRISLCLIARDEAAFLERCLRSAQGLADEIVLVDTGSQDDTPAVAERLGARVLHLPWQDDFAAPRNASLEAATGDWVFVLDCDEVIASRDLGAIRRAAVAGGCDGYLLTTRNYTRERNRARGVACRGEYPEEKGYEGWFPTTKVRLFRNDPRIRFRGAVHETVEQSILDAGGRIGECPVPVHHYGYVEKARTPERYLGVAEKKAQQEPDNPRAFYELASVYGDLRRYDDAIRAIERTIALIETDGLERHRGSHLEMELVFNAYGSLLDGARRYDDAIRAHEKALAFNPKSYQALNNLGILRERKGDLPQALSCFEQALSLAPDVALIRENVERVKRRVDREPGTVNRPSPRLRYRSGTPLPHVGEGRQAQPTGERAVRITNHEPRTTNHGGTGESGKLSVCLIVKDAEETLDACLNSVRGLADEIVVVDTGSSDSTVEIARRHGAKIGHFAWCDDFAAARNASLRLATGDWVLWMDADDVLPPEERDKVRRAMARGRQEAFYFILENVGADRSRYPQLRLFPNAPGAAFERPVHEQIVPSLERLGIACLRTDIRVVHTGYTTPERTAEKRRKYLRMMRRWLEMHPEDADIRFRVAHTLYGEGDLKAAEAELRTLTSDETLSVSRPSIARMARTFLGRVLMDRGRHDEALAPLKEAAAMAPESALARLYLGECCLALGQPEQASEHLSRALAHPDGDPFFPLDPAAFRTQCERLMERCKEQRTEIRPSPRLTTFATPLPHAGEGKPSGARRGEGRSPTPDPRPPAGSGEGGRLSLTMIVKNEEARLGRCLENVQGLVDEIVVVDTGSADRTVEVARRYGAKVHYFEWCEDFSAARNEAIRRATGDWIMWLDADDLFPKENFPKVRRAMQMGRGHAFYFRLQDEGYDATTCLQLRLFPNLPGVQFEMPVHEQVSLSLGRLGVQIVPTDIVVRHTGYTTEEVVKAKQRRYFDIMQRWLEQRPDDYIVRHHEAQTHYVWGELDEAIADYRRILSDGKAAADRNLIIVTTAHLYLGRSLMRKGDYEQALPPLHEALRMDDRYAVTHLTLGECYLRLNQHEDALRHLRLAQQYEDQVTFAPNDLRKIKALVRLFLGHVHEAKGDLEEAVRCYEASAAVGVARADSLGPLSTALRKLGRREEAGRALKQAAECDPANPHHPFNLGVMALEEKDLSRAEELFTQAMERGGGLPQALLNLGFIHKKRGAFDLAEEMYRRAAQQMEDATEAYANLGHLSLSLKRYDEAAEAFLKVRETQPGLLDVNLGLALASARRGDAALVREMLNAAVRGTFGDALTGGLPAILSPSDTAQLFSEVGRTLVGRGQPQCAAFAFETAWALDPASRTAALSLAEILRHQGEAWRAVSVYEALIQAAPGDADLFRRLGACYRQLNADAAAQACEQQAAMIEREKALTS